MELLDFFRIVEFLNSGTDGFLRVVGFLNFGIAGIAGIAGILGIVGFLNSGIVGIAGILYEVSCWTIFESLKFPESSGYVLQVKSIFR